MNNHYVSQIKAHFRFKKYFFIWIPVLLGIPAISSGATSSFGSSGAYTFMEKESLPSITATNGSAAVNEGPARWGERSLHWQWNQGGGSVKLDVPIGFEFRQEDAASNALATFMVWIYNPEPREDKLRIQFRRGQNEPDAWYDFGLNFSGWRASWVPYERDMQGVPHPDMDVVEFVMSGNAGEMRFDMLVGSTWLDSRHAAPDPQQPFVFDPIRGPKPLGIWDGLMHFKEWEEKALAEDKRGAVDAELREEIALRLETALATLERKPLGADALQERYQLWFPENEKAHPVFYRSQRPHLRALGIELGMDMGQLGRLLEDVAVSWRHSEDPEERETLEAMAMKIWQHVRNEGWDVGSGLGALHHLGYAMREFYRGLFLMRDYFESVGERASTAAWVRWYAGSGRVYQPERVSPSIDTFNTQTQGMLIGMLLNPDLRWISLESYRNWLEWNLQPTPGIVSIFKNDGSTFHHRGHYPAYANGGFRGIAPLVYTLGNTPFEVRAEYYAVLRKALLTHRFAANLQHWPNSIAGRHPTGQWTIEAEPFYWAGMGGPGGPDEELINAYLRIYPDTPRRDELLAKGFEPEPIPQGFRFMPYAGLVLQRVGSHLISVRGFSRYHWSHETYVAANHYGRYLSHGHIEVLHRGDPINHADSGFRPEGWDWNRLPGTTTRILPWEKLKANILNLDSNSGFEEMLLSTERVLGGLPWDEFSGMFAQSIRGHDKYDDQMRARKSVFFLGNRLVAVGSGISDPGAGYPVETTLWQVGLDADKEKTNRRPETEQIQRGISMRSPHEIGYYLPEGTTWTRYRGWQDSPDQRDHSPTRGFFDKAVIEHGIGPENASYLYGMDFSEDTQSVRRWADRQRSAQPWMIVHRQTPEVHHLEFPDDYLHGIAVFEPSLDLGHAAILAVDSPVLIWARQLPGSTMLQLQLADPDFRLYDVDGDQFDGKGRQVEVSIYSRPWATNPSRGEWIQLRLRGHWEGDVDNKHWRLKALDDGDTLLEFQRAESMPVEIQLTLKD